DRIVPHDDDPRDVFGREFGRFRAAGCLDIRVQHGGAGGKHAHGHDFHCRQAALPGPPAALMYSEGEHRIRVVDVNTAAGWRHPSTSLYTDHYELTMLQAALHSGAAHRRSVFEAFARRLPEGRRYGVVAGTGRILEGIEHFTFSDDQLDFLARTDVVDAKTIDWLADFRFSGDIYGYAEGEAYFPYSPILIVESSFGGFPDDRRRRRPALHRDGVPAHARGVCRRGGPRRGDWRLLEHLQSGSRLPVRCQDRGHCRPFLHPAA